MNEELETLPPNSVPVLNLQASILFINVKRTQYK